MKNKFKQITIRKQLAFTLSFLILYTLYSILYTSPAYAAGASLSLSPASGTYKTGSIFNVNINLNTGGNQTSGADAILLYEPEKLEAQSVTAGTIFSSYPVKTISSAAGKISISGIISDATASFSGEGTFATITFKTLSSGTTTVRFDFQLDEPTDSNVAKKGTQGEDILSSVSNATYTISGSGVSATPTPTPPVSGVFEITLAVLLTGLILFASGFFLFVKPLLSRS